MKDQWDNRQRKILPSFIIILLHHPLTILSSFPHWNERGPQSSRANVSADSLQVVVLFLWQRCPYLSVLSVHLSWEEEQVALYPLSLKKLCKTVYHLKKKKVLVCKNQFKKIYKTSKIEPRRFVDGLDLGCEIKRGIRKDLLAWANKKWSYYLLK